MNACSIASDTTSLRQDPMWAFDSVVPNHLFQSEWHGPSRSLKPYSRVVAPYYVFRERIIGAIEWHSSDAGYLVHGLLPVPRNTSIGFVHTA